MTTYSYNANLLNNNVSALNSLTAAADLVKFVRANNHNFIWAAAGNANPVIDMNGFGTDAEAASRGFGENLDNVGKIATFFATTTYTA